jgi:hypothetical protein
MTFDWFKLFNYDEFLALNLFSKTYQVVLEGIGQRDILVTRGNYVSVIYEDVFMSILFEDANPFTREGDAKTYAVYKDSNGDVHLGIEASE